MAKIAQLVADELGVDVRDIEKRASGSYLGVGTVAPEVAENIDLTFDEGAYELPRANYLIPGSRPAGVYTARDVLELIARDRLLPGRNVLVWGDTDYARRAVEALEASGAMVTQLAASDEIAEVLGYPRIEAVRVLRAGAEQTLSCDALVVSRGLARMN